MAADYPYLSRLTHGEAVAHHEEDLWERSFRENVCCARAIEKALRVCELKGEYIPDDCAAQVLDEYGFKRVSYLLAYNDRRTVGSSGTCTLRA